MAYVGREKSGDACAFCEAPKMADSAENLILHRGEHAYVILNLYPYTSGHLMVVPYQHCDALECLDNQTRAEMMELTTRAVAVLKQVYHPQGFNLGMNLGAAGGAGIAEHLHMHIVPRWQGDANFVSVIGGTRVVPEALEVTYQRLSEAWPNCQI